MGSICEKCFGSKGENDKKNDRYKQKSQVMKQMSSSAQPLVNSPDRGNNTSGYGTQNESFSPSTPTSTHSWGGPPICSSPTPSRKNENSSPRHLWGKRNTETSIDGEDTKRKRNTNAGHSGSGNSFNNNKKNGFFKRKLKPQHKGLSNDAPIRKSKKGRK